MNELFVGVERASHGLQAEAVEAVAAMPAIDRIAAVQRFARVLQRLNKQPVEFLGPDDGYIKGSHDVSEDCLFCDARAEGRYGAAQLVQGVAGPPARMRLAGGDHRGHRDEVGSAAVALHAALRMSRS